jgi:hypothetical protein
VPVPRSSATRGVELEEREALEEFGAYARLQRRGVVVAAARTVEGCAHALPVEARSVAVRRIAHGTELAHTIRPSTSTRAST